MKIRWYQLAVCRRWRPQVGEVVDLYINHPERKSEGESGLLKRRHIHIDRASIHYTGKESNELEMTMVLGVDPETNVDCSNINEIILNLTYEETRCVQIKDRTLREWKERIRNGEPVKPNKEQMKKLREIKNIGQMIG